MTLFLLYLLYLYLAGYVYFVGLYSAWGTPHPAAFLAAFRWPIAILEQYGG